MESPPDDTGRKQLRQSLLIAVRHKMRVGAVIAHRNGTAAPRYAPTGGEAADPRRVDVLRRFAMTAVLGLGLSVLITIALLGWLIAQDG